MNEIPTKAVLAISDKHGLRQECFDDFDEARAKMRYGYRSMLDGNGLYRGRITPDSAEISIGDVVIAQWAVSKITCGLPENACLAVSISTAHIDVDTAQNWNEGRLPCGVYAKSGYGWLIYVPGPNELFGMQPLPKCYEDIIRWAVDNGTGIVILDSDAGAVPNLPRYDWAD